MITEKIASIVSLLSTENIISINALSESGFIDIESLWTAMKEYLSLSQCHPINVCFLSTIVELAGIIEDNGTINALIRKFIAYEFKENNDWNDYVLSSFMKLCDCGGIIEPRELVHLPYDAFLYYVERHNFSVEWIIVWEMINSAICPKVFEWLQQKLESDIEFFDLSGLIMSAGICRNVDACRLLIMQEIYNRSAINVFMVCVLKSKDICVSEKRIILAKYITECCHDKEFSLLMTIMDYYSVTSDNHQNIDVVALKELIISNQEAAIMSNQIKKYKCSGTFCDLDYLLPKLELLHKMGEL